MKMMMKIRFCVENDEECDDGSFIHEIIFFGTKKLVLEKFMRRRS